MTSPPKPLTEAELNALLAATPYVAFLGLQSEIRGDELTLIMPFQESLIGNPVLPALHGGAIGAMMEIAGAASLAVQAGIAKLPKTIDITIDYLRSGRPQAVYARAETTKLGRRIANVRVDAWQRRRSELIAVLHGNFLVAETAES